MAEKRSVLMILGSARSDGNTAETASELISHLSLPTRLVDAKTLDIEPFDYSTNQHPDSFIGVVQQMLDATDVVFATPVYWFAMSGVMKAFFDRLTDLLRDPHKGLGRALAGRAAWVLATGTDPLLPAGFEVPFQQTAAHFGMTFSGVLYRRYLRDHEPEDTPSAGLSAFASTIGTSARDVG